MTLMSKKEYAQYLQYALLCARCVSKDFTVTLSYEGGEKCVKKMKLTVELTNKWYAQYLKLRGKRARLSRGRFGQHVTLKRAEILKMAPMDVAIFAYGLLHVSRFAQGALKEKAAQMGSELLGCARGKFPFELLTSAMPRCNQEICFLQRTANACVRMPSKILGVNSVRWPEWIWPGPNWRGATVQSVTEIKLPASSNLESPISKHPQFHYRGPGPRDPGEPKRHLPSSASTQDPIKPLKCLGAGEARPSESPGDLARCPSRP